MARLARKASVTGIYHVMMRGINHQQIFESADDYHHFLSAMHFAQEQYNPDGTRLPDACNYYAYALMGNHVHLLIHVKDGTIGEIIKRIAASYVYYFNRKYGRDGPLFKGRFKSEPCDDYAYFITLLRYIHQNPLKAGLCSALSNYAYSSWREYVDESIRPWALCHTDPVIRRVGLPALVEQVESALPDEVCCLDEEYLPVHLWKDEEIRDFLRTLGIQNGSDLQKRPREERNEILKQLLSHGIGPFQIERLTGVTRKVIRRLKGLD